jgi:hypothetical protein
MYTPLTGRGERYRASAYWFATGIWWANNRSDWAPDFSTDFSYFCARLADEYENEQRRSLHSIPDMWTDYVSQLQEFA